MCIVKHRNQDSLYFLNDVINLILSNIICVYVFFFNIQNSITGSSDDVSDLSLETHMPPLFCISKSIFDNLFHSDVRYNTEQRICRYAHIIMTLRLLI